MSKPICCRCQEREGELRTRDDQWLCTECATEAGNSPAAREMMEAEAEVGQHLEKGRRLS